LLTYGKLEVVHGGVPCMPAVHDLL
jgi:hypothetical protein